MAIPVGVVGAAGFAGAELVRILLSHPDFELRVITSDDKAGQLLSQVYPSFLGISDLKFAALSDADFSSCKVVFLAVPHKAAIDIAPGLLKKGLTVIDLSADFRLKDPDVYEQWYGVTHTATAELKDAVFGLPELNRDAFKHAASLWAEGKTVLVGCAGCYPTATSLAAAPALRLDLAGEGPIIVDAISGVTGAGKKATERTHFCFANENLEAYGVGVHRHTPEIEQILGVSNRVVFTPHLAPLNRGLLSTVTLPLKPSSHIDTEQVVELFASFYSDSPFVTVLGPSELPKTASVAGTNRAHIGLRVLPEKNLLVAIGAIDNLGKGAAGQAVQCANIVAGLKETAGLENSALPV